MIKDAIEKGCRRFLVGIGGSATNDGGIGMLQALGYGFLDQEGNEADTDLNRRVMSVEREDILKAPWRMVAACGRHKVEVLRKAACKGWYNVLVTDGDTAVRLLEK